QLLQNLTVPFLLVAPPVLLLPQRGQAGPIVGGGIAAGISRSGRAATEAGSMVECVVWGGRGGDSTGITNPLARFLRWHYGLLRGCLARYLRFGGRPRPPC